MTNLLRSTFFNLAFYAWGTVASICFAPTLLMSRKTAYFANQIWVRGIHWLMLHIMGIKLTVSGKKYMLSTPAIYASKHQSALETLMFHYILQDPAIVLKRELMWVPLFGWYFKKLGMIPISRDKSRGSKSLRSMIKECQRAIQNQQPIVIFPEGTRSSPGERGRYQSGVASIYQHLNLPVVPVALNTGSYWPRRGFIKKAGTVTIEFLAPIEPGLTRQEFMAVLESSIEDATKKLERVPNRELE